MWRHFSVSSSFIVSSNSVSKEVLVKKKFYDSVFVIWRYIRKKRMYLHCDLDLWYLKVKLFLWIDYDPMSVLDKFQIDMSTNSRAMKYQNIEKIPISHHWAIDFHDKKNYWAYFHENVLPWSLDQNTSADTKSERSDQYCGMCMVQWQNADKNNSVTNTLCEYRRFRKVITLNNIGSS